MTTTDPQRSRAQARQELEGELGHVRGLVFLRELLRGRGATSDELAVCDATIREARERLAHASQHFATAA